MMKNRKMIYIIMFFVLILISFLSLSLGVANLSFSHLIDGLINGMESGMAGNIFWYVRVPRTLSCLLAGAGLAVSGLIIQNVLSNKLASPGIIGVNAGAGLAVTICCSLGILSGWIIAGSAFVGALLAVLLVVSVAQKVNASRTTVILGGVAVNSFLNAANEAIITLFPDVGVMSADFRVGGFTSVTLARVLPACFLIIFAIFVLSTLCNELDLMDLGEEIAQGLGLDVKKMRTIFLILAALLAGASVSFAGLLGFVGLIIPHISRRVIGNDSKHLILFCILGGATFVTGCDLISRLVFVPYEIPVGILMSFIGGPFFVYLLLRSKGGHQHG